MKSVKQMKLIFYLAYPQYFMYSRYEKLLRYFIVYILTLKSSVDFALYKVYTSQLELYIYQVFKSPMWLVATILDCTALYSL